MFVAFDEEKQDRNQKDDIFSEGLPVGKVVGISETSTIRDGFVSARKRVRV
jgi:hypothetical protein